MGMYFVKDWYCQKKKKTYQGIWVPKTWYGMPTNRSRENIFYGSGVWTDGTDMYYTYEDWSYYPSKYVQKKLNRATDTWEDITWPGSYYPRDSEGIWTAGDNIYWSNGTLQYTYCKYNRQTKTWESFDPGPYIYGADVWTDGTNTYYSTVSSSDGPYHYKFNNGRFNQITFSGNGSWFFGKDIWSDGTDIFASSEFQYSSYNETTQSVFNKSDNSWDYSIWRRNYSYLRGRYIWSDGINYYHSSGNTTQLDKSNSTWVSKTWQGYNSIYGQHVWKDGDHIYYSYATNQYELI